MSFFHSDWDELEMEIVFRIVGRKPGSEWDRIAYLVEWAVGNLSAEDPSFRPGHVGVGQLAKLMTRVEAQL